MNPESFTEILLNWWSDNKRNLPWKKNANPYKIWISEIILQQTRVDQGTPYYLKFVKQFPNIQILAMSSEDQVLKAWEGLGYYSRARNLHDTAKYISNELNGIFPNQYEDILKLKGVGPYTAAAISSFAFGLSHPVVDGNVNRLISRILGLDVPIDLQAGKKIILEFVTMAVSFANPADFNQALMDFGAIQCVHSNPDCKKCIFTEYCRAFNEDRVKEIPSKSKKSKRINRYFHYFDVNFLGQNTLLHKRESIDIWKNLYQLPLLETENQSKPKKELIIQELSEIIPDISLDKIEIKLVFSSVQILTHRNIHGSFYKLSIHQWPNKINKDHYLVERSKVSNFALPKIITDYFKTIHF